MFHSAEIRWFAEGDTPDEVRERFTKAGLAVDEEPRVDEYLVLPGATVTGVKFREYPGDDRASFEIKTRTSEPVTLRAAGSAEGIMDTWVKWSCRPTDPASFRQSITAGKELWVYVEKRRCLRMFSMDSGEPVEVDPRTDRPAEGCQFELTAIRASADQNAPMNREKAERWWSLSFESFGNRAKLRDYASATAKHALANWSLAGLDTSSSLSYAAWLLALAERRGLNNQVRT